MTGPKICVACNLQGDCIETRQHAHHVRRRYECAGCGWRWTTAELRLEETRELKDTKKTFTALRTHLQGVLSDRTG